MAGPESEHIYGIQLRESADDGSDFSNADADYRIAFLGEDGQLHAKDSAGTVTSLGGDVSAHTGDTSDAHDASAISVLDTATNFTGTDVEAVLAELQDNIDAVGGSAFAGVHAVKTASFPTLTTAVRTTLVFDGTDVYDTDAYHDPGGANPSRLTVPTGKDGTYVPWTTVEFATNSTSYRELVLMKNGGIIYTTTAMSHATVGTRMMVTWLPIPLVATDYLEVQARQASGGNLATTDQQFGMYLLPGS